MAAGAVPIRESGGVPRLVVRARLLGPFLLQSGERTAGPWGRPSARRLCELLLVSPGRRVGKEAACEALFPQLGAAAATHTLRRVVFMARAALASLGPEATGLLRADRDRLWASKAIEVDLVAHQEALHCALALPPGGRRDELLAGALGEQGVLLEDEPYADWAAAPREALELLRQRAAFRAGSGPRPGFWALGSRGSCRRLGKLLGPRRGFGGSSFGVGPRLLGTGPTPSGVDNVRALPERAGGDGVGAIAGSR